MKYQGELEFIKLPDGTYSVSGIMSEVIVPPQPQPLNVNMFHANSYGDVTAFNRDGNKCMQMGDYVYTMGGWQPSDSYNDVYRAKYPFSKWERVANAPWSGRHTFARGKFGDTLRIAGGDTYHPTNDMWSTLDPSGLWTKEASIPGQQRFLYGDASDGERFWIIGGLGNNLYYPTPITDVVMFDGSTWATMAAGLSQFGKNLSGAAVYFPDTKKIYVVSGGPYSQPNDKTVWSSSNYGATWNQLPDIPFPGRQYHDMIYWEGRIWCIFGTIIGTGNQSDIYYMDNTETWHQFQNPNLPLVAPRHATGVATYKDTNHSCLVMVCGNGTNDCWIIEKI